MIVLVPKWAHNYDEFWTSIRRRNLWFIQLRYLFVCLLFIFLVLGEFLLNLKLSETQILSISLTTLSILGYNIILYFMRPHVGRAPEKFNCMHLSLIQMMLDLISLMIIVYYTGIIDSPFVLFFIFQIVIGSLILRGVVVYFVTSIIIIIFILLAILQLHQMVPTHYITGLYITPPEHPTNYVIQFIAFFSVMLLFLVYLANTITARLYKREMQLRSSLLKLDEAETTKQKYIMGVVHEIKSPIAAVQSILDLILKKFLGPVEEEVEKKLLRARQRSDDAITLINNVLRISKIKLLNVASAEELCIIEIIENIIEKKLDNVRAKGIHIVVDDNRDIQKLIKGDPLLLEVALSNIIGNSIKYGNSKGIIKIILCEPDPDKLQIQIVDDGIGIPKNELDTIFQQFYRASNVKESKDFEGSGMGLAVVKEIIEHHGGEITISSPAYPENQKNSGTMVTIILPETNKKRLTHNRHTMYD